MRFFWVQHVIFICFVGRKNKPQVLTVVHIGLFVHLYSPMPVSVITLGKLLVAAVKIVFSFVI